MIWAIVGLCLSLGFVALVGGLAWLDRESLTLPLPEPWEPPEHPLRALERRVEALERSA